MNYSNKTIITKNNVELLCSLITCDTVVHSVGSSETSFRKGRALIENKEIWKPEHLLFVIYDGTGDTWTEAGTNSGCISRDGRHT